MKTRRSFLKTLGIGAVSLAVLPSVITSKKEDNLLEDYETGTFTPIGGGIGQYTRIGDMVTISINSDQSTYNLKDNPLLGLPFS